MTPRQVTIRVPATTANLGPGFDTLGVALALHNRVTVSMGDDLPPLSSSMMREAAAAFFRAAKRAPRPLAVSIRGEVPVSRGLGSSVTVRLGVVAGLNELCGRPLGREALLSLVTDLEGHPDNAAPALVGGFVASAMVGNEVRYCRIEVPSRLKFVAVIPELQILTRDARRVLPRRVPLADGVANLNRVALITAAFALGRYDDLRGLFDDRFHQPYRHALLPPLFDVIRAGERAGALGGWLSGSGSTIMCLTLADARRVARAMTGVLRRGRMRCEAKILTVDNAGLVVG